MWAVIGVVPVVAIGAAYSMGAFSTSSPPAPVRSTSFTGDDEWNNMSAGRRKKTKKSKSGHKKTKRRS